MAIHPPKYISSKKGLGVDTRKRMRFLSDRIGIGTEVWQKITAPWQESGVVIADKGYTWITKWEVGKPYIISKFYNVYKDIVGIYCDICKPVTRQGDDFVFEDMYLDVWWVPGGRPLLLDEDELEIAEAAGFISSTERVAAMRAATQVVTLLLEDPAFLQF